ncbi:MAG: DNA polymerase III subunit delta' [Burkholderiales bacterium]|nr:DNA polymerase III subunit delta' [Burkholderiales bacterium]
MIDELQAETWSKLRALRARLPHALLLHGPPGVGKLALAERFAQSLLCESGAAPSTPCGRCRACRWFLAASHPDVRFVEPEAIARQAGAVQSEEGPAARSSKPSSEIRIDQVRALADFVNLASYRGGRRIAILHPAEDMNVAAANALLKNLEEPPQGAVFLLVSHRPWRLPATVRSRCVAVAVSSPPFEAACAWLTAQGVQDAAHWLAFAGGAPRRALELSCGDARKVSDTLLRGPRLADVQAVASTESREALELLAELLQKCALDRAFRALGGRGKYFQDTPLSELTEVPGKAWLDCARRLGELRQLVRHPLNPRLVAADLLAQLPHAETR